MKKRRAAKAHEDLAGTAGKTGQLPQPHWKDVMLTVLGDANGGWLAAADAKAAIDLLILIAINASNPRESRQRAALRGIEMIDRYRKARALTLDAPNPARLPA